MLTKAVFIVGGEAGVRMAEKLGAQAVIVDAEGRIWKSRTLALQGGAAP